MSGAPTDVLAGISTSEIVRVCQVHPKTARRWKSGATRTPESALLVLARDLGCFEAAWAGWRIRGDQIISPDGWMISRGDALTVPFMHSQIAALRQDLADARAQLEALKREPQADDQPLPSQWTTAIKTA